MTDSVIGPVPLGLRKAIGRAQFEYTLLVCFDRPYHSKECNVANAAEQRSRIRRLWRMGKEAGCVCW